jgi:hypothetical protein
MRVNSIVGRSLFRFSIPKELCHTAQVSGSPLPWDTCPINITNPNGVAYMASVWY